jgi:hypothetical protein
MFCRPSPKFLSFLSKHYALSSYVPQTNNFVVFRKYFDAAGNPPINSYVLKPRCFTPRVVAWLCSWRANFATVPPRLL